MLWWSTDSKQTVCNLLVNHHYSRYYSNVKWNEKCIPILYIYKSHKKICLVKELIGWWLCIDGKYPLSSVFIYLSNRTKKNFFMLISKQKIVREKPMNRFNAIFKWIKPYIVYIAKPWPVGSGFKISNFILFLNLFLGIKVHFSISKIQYFPNWEQLFQLEFYVKNIIWV